MFQHTAARRRLHSDNNPTKTHLEFQHTAARRRLQDSHCRLLLKRYVSTHSRTKAAANKTNNKERIKHVSTHSRTKAAAFDLRLVY